ncbi:MAG: LON peptidase substrate-binding domain-containing protein, partial [Bacteroidota bacterium]
MSFFHLNSDTIFEAEIPIGTQIEEQQMFDENIPDKIGILTLKNTVLFPGVVIPITVGRDKSIKLVKEAYQQEDKFIGVVAQRNFDIENPRQEDLYDCGTLARILKLIKMPDGSITIVIQGRNRFKIHEYIHEDPYFIARIYKLQEIYPPQEESKAIMYGLKEEASKIIDLAPNIPSEAKIALENIESLSFLANFIAANLNLEVEEKQEILEIDLLQ